MADQLSLPSPKLRRSLKVLYAIDTDFQRIEAIAGPLQVRRGEPTLGSLVRTMVGQQLSAKAASSIFTKLEAALLTTHSAITPQAILDQSDEMLRSLGLSQAKVRTCQALAEALASGRLNLAFSDRDSDEEITAQLTQIKGIGPWTAEIFMLFCLERLDVFPAADLALQVAYQRLKQWSDRPSCAQLIEAVSPLSPHRGTAAHLLWHYYRTLTA